VAVNGVQGGLANGRSRRLNSGQWSDPLPAVAALLRW
jgi:hypothetical protein